MLGLDEREAGAAPDGFGPRCAGAESSNAGRAGNPALLRVLRLSHRWRRNESRGECGEAPWDIVTQRAGNIGKKTENREADQDCSKEKKKGSNSVL